MALAKSVCHCQPHQLRARLAGLCRELPSPSRKSVGRRKRALLRPFYLLFSPLIVIKMRNLVYPESHSLGSLLNYRWWPPQTRARRAQAKATHSKLEMRSPETQRAPRTNPSRRQKGRLSRFVSSARVQTKVGAHCRRIHGQGRRGEQFLHDHEQKGDISRLENDERLANWHRESSRDRHRRGLDFCSTSLHGSIWT